MPANARRESTTYSSTDTTTDNRLSVPEKTWDGSQARQASWFNEKLKRAEADFEFHQLCVSGTVTLEKSGAIAVHSPEHALEHAEGRCKGTMRAPNRRVRESLLTRSLANMASTVTSSPAPSGAHGGFPTPTPTTAPATSATSITTKPSTMLENALGELAGNYKLASEMIEKAQLRFLNYFLNGFESQRLADRWRKKCEASGTMFIVNFLADMDSKGVSITAEETIETSMRQMLEAGLTSYGDINFTNYLEFTGAYEELNVVRLHPIDDKSLAHQYKRLILSLSPTLNQTMLLRIALLEGECRARGEDPNKDPVAIVNEAAGIVLEDEANTEMLKQVKQGRAFAASGFDPQRNARSTAGTGGSPSPPGGQTWSVNSSGPAQHMSGMRDCIFCTEKNNVEKSKRAHVDLQCPYATKAEKDALLKERTAKAKAKKDAWKERQKAKGGTTGAAKMVSSTVDDADAVAADRIFNGGANTLLDLDQLLGSVPSATGHALMVSKAAPMGRLAATHTGSTPTAPSSVAGTVSTLLSPSVGQAPSEVGAPAVDTRKIYVIISSGDDRVDSVTAGIWLGHWRTTILPAIADAYRQEQLKFDSSSVKLRTKSVASFEAAVSKCTSLDTPPIFMGPHAVDGLKIGDDVEEHLQADADGAASSDPGSDSESPPVPTPNLTPRRRTRTIAMTSPTNLWPRSRSSPPTLTWTSSVRSSSGTTSTTAGRRSRQAPVASTAVPSSRCCRRCAAPSAPRRFPTARSAADARSRTCRWASPWTRSTAGTSTSTLPGHAPPRRRRPTSAPRAASAGCCR